MVLWEDKIDKPSETSKKGGGGIQSKLEKKKEKIQQTILKFLRDYYERLYANKQDNLEEMDNILGVKPSKTAPGRDRKYEQTNSNTEVNTVIKKNSLQKKQKPRVKWLHRWILPKV